MAIQQTLAVSTLADAPAPSPIGWYVHLPFCTTKCGYCDFYSLPTIPALIDNLVAALQREMSLRDPGRAVETVFVGGGTPTVLPADALAAILRTITAHTGPVAEFSVEANPSSTDELKLELLRRLGVNRISFGAQSFNPRELAVLERIHDPTHIADSVRAARAAGFDNLNLDLIYAIPGQTLASWGDSLARAIELEPDHLSCYALMYEPGTALTRLKRDGRLLACDEERELDMFHATIDTLTTAGFEHYEISNFARPGRRCRANIIYWENREYLGIGPSAVSYLDGVRRKNVADVRKYVDGLTPEPLGRASAPTDPDVRCVPDVPVSMRASPPNDSVGRPSAPTDPDVGCVPDAPVSMRVLDARRPDPASIVAEEERLDPARRARETAVQMLRLTAGIDAARFRRLTGIDPHAFFESQIARFSALGLLTADPTSIRLTRTGLAVANRVMEEFVG